MIVAATQNGIVLFDLKNGFYNQEDFISILEKCLQSIVISHQKSERDNSILVLTDMNKIHLDPFGLRKEDKPIRNVLEKFGSKRYYLPPSSPHLNPIESIFTNLKTKLLKKEIRRIPDLKDNIYKLMVDISQESVEVYFDDVQKSLLSARGEESYSYDNFDQSFEPSCL